MKYTLITLGAAALLSMGSIAVADEPTQGPIAMTDAQMDQIVAGGAQGEFILTIGAQGKTDVIICASPCSGGNLDGGPHNEKGLDQGEKNGGNDMVWANAPS
jgi:hypothetical protein